MSDLDQLEIEVATEYFALVAERTQGDAFDPVRTKWLRVDRPGLPLVPFDMQFPREQWLIVPTRRTVTLLLVRRVITLLHDKPNHPQAAELYHQLGFLWLYGGKIRVA
ncbi:hypothetical protein VXD82_02040 [Mycobacteroides chelonae]|uniref:hypothetical protein n=1 Tax=Mycobacteroides chelonae TaxID=1774 RepID=UPI003204A767